MCLTMSRPSRMFNLANTNNSNHSKQTNELCHLGALTKSFICTLQVCFDALQSSTDHLLNAFEIPQIMRDALHVSIPALAERVYAAGTPSGTNLTPDRNRVVWIYLRGPADKALRQGREER